MSRQASSTPSSTLKPVTSLPFAVLCELSPLGFDKVARHWQLSPELHRQLLALASGNIQPHPKITYPFVVSDEPRVILDRIAESMYYLWMPQKVTHDMILIKIKRVGREIESNTGGRIMVDIGYLEQGRIVLRINLAEPDDGGIAFWDAVISITDAICTTTDVNTRDSFLSEMFHNDPISDPYIHSKR